MRDLLSSITRLPLSQQLALAASGCCLVATLTLVVLAAQSNRYTQQNLQAEFGQSMAEHLADRLGNELATGDMLGVAGELNRITQHSQISAGRALDVEGLELSAAGVRRPDGLHFTSSIVIAGDTAGTAEVTIDTEGQRSAQQQFLLSMSGLALLLSIGIYFATRAMAQRLAKNLQLVSAELAAVTGESEVSPNEVTALQERVAALPLELLQPRVIDGDSEDHYADTAILFIYLRSLPGYLETVDERRLQRYVATVHRMIYGAAGFYSGELQVVRQFGLVIWFKGQHKTGSPALRGASCAWLIQQAAPELETSLRLSVGLGLSLGGSELGRGDERDIYPGLYTQAAVDELEVVARQTQDGIHIADFVSQDLDLVTRMAVEPAGDDGFRLGDLADGQRDLLERQLQILLKALVPEDSASTGD